MPKTAPKKKLSVLKRIRQNEKRRERNAYIKATLKTSVKKARLSLDGKSMDKAKELVLDAAKKLDKAVTKGVIHKNTASRKKSRLAHALNALQKKAG